MAQLGNRIPGLDPVELEPEDGQGEEKEDQSADEEFAAIPSGNSAPIYTFTGGFLYTRGRHVPPKGVREG